MAACVMCELWAVEQRGGTDRWSRWLPRNGARSERACRRASARRPRRVEHAGSWPFSVWWDQALL